MRKKYNEENLLKLQNYLLSDKMQAFFTMEVYCEEGHGHALVCGSVGCAVGHGPYAGIPKSVDEDWFAYSERCFSDCVGWDWLFGADWQYVDNTAQGAGMRIFWLLQHGEEPDGWDCNEETVQLYTDFYKTEMAKMRNAAMNELTQQAQELDMGY